MHHALGGDRRANNIAVDALRANGLFGERGTVVVESEGIIRGLQQVEEREEAPRQNRGMKRAGKGGDGGKHNNFRKNR